jgi:hypothetical protein
VRQNARALPDRMTHGDAALADVQAERRDGSENHEAVGDHDAGQPEVDLAPAEVARGQRGEVVADGVVPGHCDSEAAIAVLEVTTMTSVGCRPASPPVTWP